MQVTETLNESLSRSYSVRVPAAELGALLEARIAEISPTLRLKGFRPGKVPPAHVRRVYGKSLMGEIVEKTLGESSQKVVADNRLRVAVQPELTPSSDMEEVLAGRQDLTYALDVEVMPEFEPADITDLTLTRLVYRPTDAEIDAAVTEIAAQNRTYAPRKAKTAKAETGDQLLIDFVGRIDGAPFEGGAAEDAEIVLGAGRFIPGFEDQLVDAVAGKTATVDVTFPETYQVEALRGKPASFDVKVKEVRAPKDAKADDALAQSLGLADLAALREAVRSNLESEYEGAARFKLKRALLDALDSRHEIPLPPRMVETEFESIWKQVQEDEAREGRSPEDEGKSEETLRAEYRRIAERRVRLGLVLAEIGRREEVVVSDEELTEAMRAEARRYGQMAQQMFDFLRQNAQAQASLRAPIYEEKVVEVILSRVEVSEKEVSKETLLAEDDLPEGIVEPTKAATGKPATKKAEAKAGKEGQAKKTAPRTAKSKSTAESGKIDQAAKAETASASKGVSKASKGKAPGGRSTGAGAKPKA